MTTLQPQNTTLWRIRVTPRSEALDAHGAAVLRDIHELGLAYVRRVGSSRLFLLEAAIHAADVERIAQELLADPITEAFSIRCSTEADTLPEAGFDAAIEVHLKGGVMDPVAASTLAAIADMGIDTVRMGIATGRLYQLAGVRSLDELSLIARRLLSNDCIEDVYLTGFGRADHPPDRLPVASERAFELRYVPLRALDDAGLMKLSREGHLFCSLEEMRAIRDHYQSQQRDPTDLELETFAQTWSEHCVHKTLKSAVRYRGEPFPASSKARQERVGENTVEVVYDNLLRDTIARATHELIDSGRAAWCLSVFEDNAGIIAFDSATGIAFKAETHNHPSAIEPYGGAATGIGGCIRDIMGCGLGAKPIANTDVFCVASPDFPMDDLPQGVLHPRRVLKGVVAGVRDYGNRMGIPTVNGAIVFDDRYLGNPLVFCGCVGLIPRDRIRKAPRPADLVVLIGGRTGRDGIHGATFSSAELTGTHADEFSHAVQIGNAITQKQVLDAMLQARDHPGGCLYTAVTDCGAGGLSSAVGEMGSKLGATVDLEQVPLKYAGLRYDEIWISEAQERMVLSVPPENWEAFRAICQAEGVEASVIGAFRDDGRLVIRYEGQVVGDIDAHFLHNGIPRKRMEATWSAAPGLQEPVAAAPRGGRGREIERRRDAETERIDGDKPGEISPSLHLSISPSVRATSSGQRLLRILSDLNTASREWIIRQYDHEVQGGSVIKPLTGPGEGPSDAAIIRPRLDSQRGIAIGNGICPQLSDLDPYWMAVAAIDEALRNVVCVGGDPDRTAILDNFSWGNCEDPQTFGALVRACQGCYDAAVTYGLPFISGKDSLNNEFALNSVDARRLADRIPLHNDRIRIPGTLLVSAVSVIEDVRRCVTMDAKAQDPQSAIRNPAPPAPFYFVGLQARHWPQVDIAVAAALHRAVAVLIRDGHILAAHDCGEEGILPALAEMAFAGRCGMDVDFSGADDLPNFDPVPCGYILQAPDSSAEAFTALASTQGILCRPVARPRSDQKFRLSPEADLDLSTLAAAWRQPLDW